MPETKSSPRVSITRSVRLPDPARAALFRRAEQLVDLDRTKEIPGALVIVCRRGNHTFYISPFGHLRSGFHLVRKSPTKPALSVAVMGGLMKNSLQNALFVKSLSVRRSASYRCKKPAV